MRILCPTQETCTKELVSKIPEKFLPSESPVFKYAQKVLSFSVFLEGVVCIGAAVCVLKRSLYIIHTKRYPILQYHYR